MELLAPAGSIDSLRGAVHAGADAIYIGGSRFGARAYADNPQEQQLLEGLDYCHLHQVRVYLTVNTLFRERELAELPAFLEPYYRNGLDGVIVQDLGAARVIRRYFPDLPLHASTQMTIASPYSVGYLKQMGFCRIVPARELSLKEVSLLAHASGMEIEVFVHGALCYCYSGQCLASSMIGGRSGNRGRCAQPCRLPWQLEKNGSVISSARDPYLLSLKDLCALPYLNQFAENGVTSLKIEGRMKRPEYTAGVVQIYRKYLDLLQSGTGLKIENGCIVPEEEDFRMLQDLYSRGGFTPGYSMTANGPSMMSMHRPNHLGSYAAVLEKESRGGSGRSKAAAADRTARVRGKKGASIKGSAGQKTGLMLRVLADLSTGDILEPAQTDMPDAAWTADRDIPAGACLSVPDEFRRFSPGTRLFRTRNEALLSSLADLVQKEKPQIKIKGVLMLFPGKPAILEAYYQSFHVRMQGETVQEAQNHPLSREALEKQIMRTGDSPFSFESLEICGGDSVFLPVRELNRLRRDTLEQLRREILSAFRRNKTEKGSLAPDDFREKDPADRIDRVNKGPADENVLKDKLPDKRCPWPFKTAFPFLTGYSVSVQEEEQLDVILSEIPQMKHRPDRIILDSSSLWMDPAAVERVRKSGCACYFALAPVLREKTAQWYRSSSVMQRLLEADGFQVRTLDAAGFAAAVAPDIPVTADEGLYAYNPETVRVLNSFGIHSRVLPAELTCLQMEHLTGQEENSRPGEACVYGAGSNWNGAELTVYGRQLLMITAQCLQKNIDSCTGHPCRLSLRDRKNMVFPVRTQCEACCNTIWNSLPLSLFSCTQQILRLKSPRMRLSFTFEDRSETLSVLRQFSAFLDGKEFSLAADTTRGHFIKGVE